jgi:peptidyl-dipeptidase A
MRLLCIGVLCVSFTIMAQEGKAPDAQGFIDGLAGRVAPLSKALALNYWAATATGNDALYAKQGEIELELRRVFAEKEGFETARALKADASITDPLLRRQIELIHLAYLENQMDPVLLERMVALSNAIEARFNTHRALFEGKRVSDNLLAEVLKSERNVGRRKAAWEASKTVGEAVSSDLIALVKLRNEAARQLGFRNYYEMRMTLNEQDPAEIARLFDELARVTESPFLKIKARVDAAVQKRFKVKPKAIRPHHYQDFFFQEVQEVGEVDMDAHLVDKDVRKMVEAFYNGIGLPVTEMLDRSDLTERDGKYQHAYCIDIDRMGDVRTMCSLKNNRYWLETLMHELGHGVYSMNIDAGLPWFLREDAHTFITEAVAELFGALPTNPVWLKSSVGLPAQVVDGWAPDLALEKKMGLLIFCRWSLVMVHFERALYENPDGNLNALWWDLVEKYQKVRRPDKRNKPDWAAKIHLTSSPVYYHNYMLGNLYASQLLHHMASTVAGHPDINTLDFAGDSRLGKFLRDQVFAPGKTLRWDALVERSTGKPLDPAFFASDVAMP